MVLFACHLRSPGALVRCAALAARVPGQHEYDQALGVDGVLSRLQYSPYASLFAPVPFRGSEKG